MKKISMIALLCTVIFCSCKKNNTTAELEKKLAQLEKSNTEKDKKIMSLAITVQVMAKNLNHFDHSGIWNFAAQSDFWENTYQIDPNRCNTNCAATYEAALRNCNPIGNPAEYNQCIIRASDWRINCISGCPPVSPH